MLKPDSDSMQKITMEIYFAKSVKLLSNIKTQAIVK